MTPKHTTKKFWLQVRRDFNNKTGETFLCLASPEFRGTWENEEEKPGILKLANEWLQKSVKWKKHDAAVKIHANPDTATVLIHSHYSRRDVRKTFLNAMCKKFS